ncbi:hypothetical protein PanWU01x14_273100 [Parasponia andersonii]|uniref:Uncharacterized protein n=1 Tax=Parasponia andersonii TaxID=3476 RepID=A0A2P5B403_PARAD|nr:hypothetical protein PanWU01x14_273100 [Parasponia andersonii]
MKVSEISEEKDEDADFFVNTETQRERIRRIIEYQKSLYVASVSSSSSSLSSSAASSSSSSSSHRTNSLINLMKTGSTSLRRLFDMEHTSLATYFENYSGSPMIKPILWGSDTENEDYDPWGAIKQFRPTNGSESDGEDEFDSKLSFGDREFESHNRKVRIRNRKLGRKKSFRRLPRFGFWRCRRFRFFRLRLRKLRIATRRRKL